MESEIETNLTFLKDITLNESPFENLEEGDPISPLEDGIEDYFHIEKKKWEIVGPQFDCALIYDTDEEDEIESGLPFLSGIIYDEISIDTLEKKGHYFPLHEKDDFEEEKHVEYNTSPSPLPYPFVHHLKSSKSDSLTPFQMIPSDLQPFPPSEYGVKEEPLIEYTFSLLTHPQDHDQFIILHFGMIIMGNLCVLFHLISVPCLLIIIL